MRLVLHQRVIKVVPLFAHDVQPLFFLRFAVYFAAQILGLNHNQPEKADQDVVDLRGLVVKRQV